MSLEQLLKQSQEEKAQLEEKQLGAMEVQRHRESDMARIRAEIRQNHQAELQIFTKEYVDVHFPLLKSFSKLLREVWMPVLEMPAVQNGTQDIPVELYTPGHPSSVTQFNQKQLLDEIYTYHADYYKARHTLKNLYKQAGVSDDSFGSKVGFFGRNPDHMIHHISERFKSPSSEGWFQYQHSYQTIGVVMYIYGFIVYYVSLVHAHHGNHKTWEMNVWMTYRRRSSYYITLDIKVIPHLEAFMKQLEGPDAYAEAFEVRTVFRTAFNYWKLDDGCEYVQTAVCMAASPLFILTDIANLISHGIRDKPLLSYSSYTHCKITYDLRKAFRHHTAP